MAKFLESELLYLVAYALKCPGKIKYTSNINIPNYCDFGISFRGNYIFLYPYTENYSLLEPILINRESLVRDKISNIPDFRARIILRKISKYLDILDEEEEEDPVNVEALTNIIFSKHNSNLIELNPKLLGAGLTPVDFIEETQRLWKDNIPSGFKILARKIVSSLYSNDVLEYRDFYGNAIEFLLNKVDEESIELVNIVCLFLGKIDSDNTYIKSEDHYYLWVYSDIVTIDNWDVEIWRINIADEPPFKRAEFILNSWKETGMHLINSLATIINFEDKLEKIAQLTKMVSDVDKFSRF